MLLSKLIINVVHYANVSQQKPGKATGRQLHQYSTYRARLRTRVQSPALMLTGHGGVRLHTVPKVDLGLHRHLHT